MVVCNRLSGRDSEPDDRRGHGLPNQGTEPERVFGLATADQERIRVSLGLSPREMEVALCSLEGLSDGGIARRLGNSTHTVRTHLARVFRKLRVANRSAIGGRVLIAYVSLRERQSAK